MRCGFFAQNQPELVSKWLENSLQEHNFGLAPAVAAILGQIDSDSARSSIAS